MHLRIIYLLLFIFFSSEILAQNGKSDRPLSSIKKTSLEEFENDIFINNNKLKIIFLYDKNCSLSDDLYPLIYEMWKSSNDQFNLVPLIIARSKKISEYEDHIFYKNYTNIFYLIPKTKFLNSSVNYDKVVKQLCEKCETYYMGYSDLLIYNKENEIIYNSDSNITKKEKIDFLNKLLSKNNSN